jgi:hypothetical protein
MDNSELNEDCLANTALRRIGAIAQIERDQPKHDHASRGECTLVSAGDRCSRPNMVQAKFMTPEQVEQLVQLAKQNTELWQKLKERESEGESRYAAARAQGKWPDLHARELPPLTRPSWEELLIEFLKAQYGEDYYRFERGRLTMALRKEIRKELNLPV